jgi:hypothetical protein
MFSYWELQMLSTEIIIDMFTLLRTLQRYNILDMGYLAS